MKPLFPWKLLPFGNALIHPPLMSPLLSPRTLTQGFSILSTQSRHPAGRQQWDRKDTSSALFSSFPSILSLKTSQAAHPHGQMQPSSHEREASQLFSLQPPTCSALTQMPPQSLPLPPDRRSHPLNPHLLSLLAPPSPLTPSAARGDRPVFQINASDSTAPNLKA